MASFTRLVGGGWQVTLTGGATYFHSWQWGPGRYSPRKMIDASDAVAEPWAGEVLYWHSGCKQVRPLSLHGDIPGIGRGVGEGTMRFAGKTAHGVFDLHQPPGRRKLGSRWVFDRPDKYHDTLLEDSEAGPQPMNEWDFVRISARSGAQPRSAVVALPNPSAHLKVFEALLGCYVVRSDIEKDGTLRSRLWSFKGTESTLLLDVHHMKLHPKLRWPLVGISLKNPSSF